MAPVANAQTVYFGENQNPGGAVSGDPVTARAAFLAALTGVSTEDFESVAVGSSSAPLTFTGSAGNILGTLTGGGTVANAPVTGAYATSGTNFYDNQFNAFTISFTSAIAAFGFYGTDIGDVGESLQVTLDAGLAGERVYTVSNTVNGANGSLLFWGITDTANPFTTITFAQSGADRFGFDDMTVGDIRQVTGGVPEPATWAMMLMGFGAMGYSLRRRPAARVRYA
jgi:hypothetical protein